MLTIGKLHMSSHAFCERRYNLTETITARQNDEPLAYVDYPDR